MSFYDNWAGSGLRLVSVDSVLRIVALRGEADWWELFICLYVCVCVCVFEYLHGSNNRAHPAAQFVLYFNVEQGVLCVTGRPSASDTTWLLRHLKSARGV